METEYTIDYFIEKFSNIPEEEIGMGGVEGRHCSLYHLGVRETPMCDPPYTSTDELEALSNIFNILYKVYTTLWSKVWRINDNSFRDWVHKDVNITGDTPKQRILSALQICKEKENEAKNSKGANMGDT